MWPDQVSNPGPLTNESGALTIAPRGLAKNLSMVALKKKIFEHISMCFYGSNLGPPGRGPSWTLELAFEQT